MQLISQITTRIRLYSSECNTTALVLEAIKQSKTNLKVYPGIYLVDVDEAGYQRQKTALKEALQTYGTGNVLGITVGNEVILNYMLDRQATDVNGTNGLAASAFLKGNFTDIRQMLTSINVNLPIGTADAASFFNTDVLSASDFGCAFIIPQQSTNQRKLLIYYFLPAWSTCTLGTPIHPSRTPQSGHSTSSKKPARTWQRRSLTSRRCTWPK
jgi:exo-beta-1,3-glucanase (GH17 family)